MQSPGLISLRRKDAPRESADGAQRNEASAPAPVSMRLGDVPSWDELLRWLREEDPNALEELWQRADATRRHHVGEAVHLRGLIEVSNRCVRQCHYCGLRAANRQIKRYRMTPEQVLECAHEARALGYGTVVLQAGEDPGLSTKVVAEIVTRIKDETGLAITLSLGERGLDELAIWKARGADRYLMRFETSNPELFASIHPPHGGQTCDRIALLRSLRVLGYETGSGILIGIPGQTYEDVARDLLMFRELSLDMVGVGPFIAHPQTPLGNVPRPEHAEQVPNSELMTYKVLALTRLMCPGANLPTTTALATLNRDSGRELGLSRGGNVVMPNVTPPEFRVLYEIYPGKACINETARQCHGCLASRLHSIGRHVGSGPGTSAAFSARRRYEELG